MNFENLSLSGRVIELALVTLGSLMVACATVQPTSNSPLPDEAELKAKVAELYRAQAANDEQAKRALVLPQIVNCGMIPSEHSDAPDEEAPVQVIAWKIKRIQFDMHNIGDGLELCPGQAVHPTSGAMVIVEQTDRANGEEASTGDLYIPWLYVDQTWYWLVDVD